MTYKGFNYLGKTYVWNKGDLYRLPYNVGYKYFGLLKCAKWLNKGLYIGSERKSFKQLQSMTTDIESSFIFHSSTDTPF